MADRWIRAWKVLQRPATGNICGHRFSSSLRCYAVTRIVLLSACRTIKTKLMTSVRRHEKKLNIICRKSQRSWRIWPRIMMDVTKKQISIRRCPRKSKTRT